jgi:hypothetical protein
MATRASTAINVTTGTYAGSTSTAVVPTPWSTATLPLVQTQVWQPTLVNLGGVAGTQAWGALFLELSLTCGTVLPYPGVEISVNYAFTATAASVTANHQQALTTASYFTLVTPKFPTNPSTGFLWVGLSPAIPILGDYIYTWIEIDDNLGQSASQALTGQLTIEQALFTSSLIYQT